MLRRAALAVAIQIGLVGGAAAQLQVVNPPGPQPVTCTGGNSVTQYPGYGQALACGGALTTGTINVGSNPQILQYQGAASVLAGPVTVSGDGAIASGGALTITKLNGQAVTLAGPLTTTGAGTTTLAFTGSNFTYTFPSASKTLMASDYSNASATTLGSTTLTLGGTTATISGLTLVAPVLGTPLSGNAANLTGLPISTGVAGLGTGVATFLATPSSANLAAALTDETGTGAAVFANGATLIAPVLGTPLSGNATNLTGLPISTGVSGLGTGVATFLQTPSSANLLAALTTSTGTGSAVFGTGPTISAAVLNGTITGTSVGTSGHVLPFLDGNNTWSGTNTFATVKNGGRVAAGTTDTILADDCGKAVVYTNAAGATVTIPASIAPASGTVCNISVVQAGAGTISVDGSAVSPALLLPTSVTGTSGVQGSSVGVILTTVSATPTAYLIAATGTTPPAGGLITLAGGGNITLLGGGVLACLSC